MLIGRCCRCGKEGNCKDISYIRPAYCYGQQSSLGLGESFNWTQTMHPTLNRRRYTTTFTNPSGTAQTLYAYPLRVGMESGYMTTEGEITNEWPGNATPAGAVMSGTSVLWRPAAINGSPALKAVGQTVTMQFNSLLSGVGILKAARVTGGSPGDVFTPSNPAFLSETLTTNPTTLYVWDVVIGAVYTAGDTGSRTVNLDSITNFLDTIGIVIVDITTNKDFVPYSISIPSGGTYHSYELTFSGGTFRPAGTVSNVLDMTSPTATACLVESPTADVVVYVGGELPLIRLYNGSQYLWYAPEDDGSYIQTCESAETGNTYAHTVGSWDLVSTKTFLPYYGVEINSPARSWPLSAPTSISIRRELYTKP